VCCSDVPKDRELMRDEGETRQTKGHDDIWEGMRAWVAESEAVSDSSQKVEK